MTYIILGLVCLLAGYVLSQLRHKHKIHSGQQQYDLAVDLYKQAEKLRRK